MTLEELRDDPKQIWPTVKTAAHRRAWWAVVLAAVLLLLTLPPQPGRYASYFVSIILFLVTAVFLSPGGQTTLSALYGARSYFVRIALGGATAPAAIGLVVAVTLVPPARNVPTVEVLVPRSQHKADPIIFMVDASAVALRSMLPAAPSAIRTRRGTSPLTFTREIKTAADVDGAAIVANQTQIGRGDRDEDRVQIPELTYVVGLDRLDLSGTVIAVTVLQPLASLQSFAVLPPPPPLAPMNLRIIR